MNGECNRGRILLVVPQCQCYGGYNHAIRNTTPGQLRDERSVLGLDLLSQKCVSSSDQFLLSRVVDPCTKCCRFFSPCVGQAIGELRKTAIQQLSLKKKPGKFLIPSGQIPDTKRANSWYQLLIGHRERSNVEKQRQNCYLKSQAGMYLNFRAIAGGALIGQNHRNRHVTCGKCLYFAIRSAPFPTGSASATAQRGPTAERPC